MTPAWFLPPKESAAAYARAFAEILKVERLAKLAGRDIRPKEKQQ